jgi:hypothetical protein
MMNFRVRFPFLAEGVEMTKRGPFDFAQDMLCAFARDIPSFGCGAAALGSLRLMGVMKHKI